MEGPIWATWQNPAVGTEIVVSTSNSLATRSFMLCDT
jgi:hypothetical protein